MHDRLTNRTDEEIDALLDRRAGTLTFNELVALAGLKLHEKALDARGLAQEPHGIDAGRDCSLAHTALEDALTRFNSACYRVAGTWKRHDPDSGAA